VKEYVHVPIPPNKNMELPLGEHDIVTVDCLAGQPARRANIEVLG
jgi:hypothetical protein